MNNTVTKQSIFLCYIEALLLLVVVDFFLYNNFSPLFIFKGLLFFSILLIFNRQNIFYNQKEIQVENVGLFTSKSQKYLFSDIEFTRNYFLGYAIRFKERTLILNYCDYKKKDVLKFIKQIEEYST